MSAIDAIDEVSGISTEWLTEMEPHCLHWNGRDVNVLLPAGTQYSRGTITTKTEHGSTSMPDLVDGSKSIPLDSVGKVALSLSAQTRQTEGSKVTTSKVTQMAMLSLAELKKPKEEYLAEFKKQSIAVLSETEDALITLSKHQGFFAVETLTKTVISDNRVLQLQTSILRLDKEPVKQLDIYRLFERIHFVKS